MARRPRSHQLEEESRRAFVAGLPSRWVHRLHAPDDYGFDYTVEIFDEDERRTPFSFHAQLKATDEPSLSKALTSLRIDRETAEEYWASPLPVLMLRYHAPSGRTFVRWFHAYNPAVALQRETEEPTKTIGFPFEESDEWTASTPDDLVAAVQAFMRFRSPELELPLRFSIESDLPDSTSLQFALRAVLRPVADLVVVEERERRPDSPYIVVGSRSSTVALADVVSVTLDYGEDAIRSAASDAADLGTAIAMVLIRVGQPNLSAQIAAACAPQSTMVLNYEVAFPLAQTFFRARRVVEALRLADAVAARHKPDARISALLLQSAVLARGAQLSDGEGQLSIEVATRMLRRSEEHGTASDMGADAYNVAMAWRRVRDPAKAVEFYDLAAQHDPSYLGRAYFHRERAGMLFETERYAEAAESYQRAIDLGDEGLVQALLADSLLYAGRYTEARATLESYLQRHNEPEDAEWRLKLFALDLVQSFGGDEQTRDIEGALAVVEPVDFERADEMTGDEAWALIERTLFLDACCAEAWFRRGLLFLALDGEQPDLEPALNCSLVAAVLHRDLPNVWNNVLVLARRSGAADDFVKDCLRMAYRHSGTGLADVLIDSQSRSEDSDPDLLALLNDVMTEIDRAQRPSSFILRLPSEDGQMSEIEFVTEAPDTGGAGAHDPNPPR